MFFPNRLVPWQLLSAFVNFLKALRILSVQVTLESGVTYFLPGYLIIHIFAGVGDDGVPGSKVPIKDTAHYLSIYKCVVSSLVSVDIRVHVYPVL